MAIRIAAPARRRLGKLLRYASVSAISTATSLGVLGLLVGVFDVASVWANVIATAVGTIPSFELNRRWVWSGSAERARVAQVLAFCGLSLGGLLVSSVAVHVASDATELSGGLIHTAAVEGANLAAYGALWVAQYVLCDRVLFGPRDPVPEPLDEPALEDARAPAPAARVIDAADRWVRRSDESGAGAG